MNKKLRSDTSEDALRHAYRLLSFKDRSEKELFDKLRKKGFSEGIINNIIILLKEKGYLNDQRLAETLKKGAKERKFLGRNGLKEYMANRGIPEDIINSVIGSDEDYIETAVNFISKKTRGCKNVDYDSKQKIFRGLLRRGFTYETINRAFKIYSMEV